MTLDDLDELEYITEEYVRSSYLAKWSDRFRFYYQSKMSREDVCIFKIFDSAYHDPDGRRSTGEERLAALEKTRPANQDPMVQWAALTRHSKSTVLHQPRLGKASRPVSSYSRSNDFPGKWMGGKTGLPRAHTWIT